LLIGGPNQSHKVNFKELPDLGKSSNKKFSLLSVNPFPEYFEEIFGRNLEKRTALSSPRFTSSSTFCRWAVMGGLNKNFEFSSVNLFSNHFEEIFGENRRKNQALVSFISPHRSNFFGGP
jgi:hypothetical protein